jgi:FMN reductase
MNRQQAGAGDIDASPALNIVAIDGSPGGGGRTATVLHAIGAADHVTLTEVSLAGPTPLDEVVASLDQADALILGSPIHRATYASPLKALLEVVPRGMWGETGEPLRGTPVALAATGASWHHFLALRELRDVLSGFFAAHVLPVGLYVPAEGFADAALTDAYRELAAQHGRVLRALARAVRVDPALRALRPQA